MALELIGRLVEAGCGMVVITTIGYYFYRRSIRSFKTTESVFASRWTDVKRATLADYPYGMLSAGYLSIIWWAVLRCAQADGYWCSRSRADGEQRFSGTLPGYRLRGWLLPTPVGHAMYVSVPRQDIAVLLHCGDLKSPRAMTPVDEKRSLAKLCVLQGWTFISKASPRAECARQPARGCQDSSPRVPPPPVHACRALPVEG